MVSSALLSVLLDERASRTRRHVPVDGAHLVAGHVFAHFFEVHAPAPEHRVELSGQGVGGEPACANIDETDLFQDLLIFSSMVTHLRVGQRGENLGDQIVGLDVLRLCLVGEAEPMSQHIRGQSLDVGWNDVAPPVHEGPGA